MLICALFLVACGCNDVGCSALSVRVADSAVDDDEEIRIYADGERLFCEGEERSVACNSHGRRDGGEYFSIDARPQNVEIHAVDAAGTTRVLWEGSPEYTIRQHQDACGDCDHAAAIGVE